MYFDNTWLTYCLLIGIAMFFASTFAAVVYTYYAMRDFKEARRNNEKVRTALLELERQEDELFDLKQHYTQQIDRINQRLN